MLQRGPKYARAMVAAMQPVAAWNTDSFSILPVGEPYDGEELNEFRLERRRL